MIGKVVFPYKSRIVEAIMNNDGCWECDVIPCLVRPLNILHSPAWNGAPFDLARCLECLETAAHWLHGEVHSARSAREGMGGNPHAWGNHRLAAPSVAGCAIDRGVAGR
jgi:hypothetical protein